MSAPVLVIGESGQVARALARIGRVGPHPVVTAGRARVDATDRDGMADLVAALRPVAVINAAAYTAVDKAESDVAAATALNADLPGELAALCMGRDIPLVHLSTDYVFDGSAKQSYREDDAIAPLGVYGATKVEGERRVRAALDRHIILRTAWVYGEDGHNFAKTMLRLGRERDELRVVADQRGCPTYAAALADVIARLTERVVAHPNLGGWGTYHATGAGETTWHGFASAIFEEAGKSGAPVPRCLPITTADYPTPARRPAYSVLDNGRLATNFGVALPDWRQSLKVAVPRILAAMN